MAERRLANPASGIKRLKMTQTKIMVPGREQIQHLIAAIHASDGRQDSQAKSKSGADLVEVLAYSGARLGGGPARLVGGHGLRP